MNKKVVVLGGGTGLSSLLKGLKMYPIDISAIVSVCDDGRSTGKLRKEFNIPAVGDIRQVLVSLSETEPLIEELLNYRFKTEDDLNGHSVGNLILAALTNITGNLTDGVESLSKVLNLKGKVIPVTEDNITLMAHMKDGTTVEGEHNITAAKKQIKDIYYKEKAVTNDTAIKAIEEADLIVLSMGSLFTSIIPDLICKDIIKTIDKSKAPILYVCNMMTQPGETDGFKVSDHIKTLNKYLGKRKIDMVIINTGEISEEIIEKYAVLEQKDPVPFDKENVRKLKVKYISDDFVSTDTGMIRHDTYKLAFYIFRETIKN